MNTQSTAKACRSNGWQDNVRPTMDQQQDPDPPAVAAPPKSGDAPLSRHGNRQAPDLADGGTANDAVGPDVPAPPPQLVAELCKYLPQIGGADWTTLRGGRVNRCWQVGDLVVKAYSPDRDSPIFPNDPVAEATILRHLDGCGVAPRLRATGQGWIAYDHVEGRIWREGDDPAPVAALLRKIWSFPPPEGLRRVESGSNALRDLAARLSPLPMPPSQARPDIAPAPPRLIHADAVCGNIICGPAGVRLIDWQCPAIGDPAEDVAAFLSPAMRWLYGGREPEPDLERHFLSCLPEDLSARYCSLKPLFHWRMMQHCLWRLRQGQADYGPAFEREKAAFQSC